MTGKSRREGRGGMRWRARRDQIRKKSFPRTQRLVGVTDNQEAGRGGRSKRGASGRGLPTGEEEERSSKGSLITINKGLFPTGAAPARNGRRAPAIPPS